MRAMLLLLALASLLLSAVARSHCPSTCHVENKVYLVCYRVSRDMLPQLYQCVHHQKPSALMIIESRDLFCDCRWMDFDMKIRNEGVAMLTDRRLDACRNREMESKCSDLLNDEYRWKLRTTTPKVITTTSIAKATSKPMKLPELPKLDFLALNIKFLNATAFQFGGKTFDLNDPGWVHKFSSYTKHAKHLLAKLDNKRFGIYLMRFVDHNVEHFIKVILRSYHKMSSSSTTSKATTSAPTTMKRVIGWLSYGQNDNISRKAMIQNDVTSDAWIRARNFLAHHNKGHVELEKQHSSEWKNVNSTSAVTHTYDILYTWQAKFLIFGLVIGFIILLIVVAFVTKLVSGKNRNARPVDFGDLDISCYKEQKQTCWGKFVRKLRIYNRAKLYRQEDPLSASPTNASPLKSPRYQVPSTSYSPEKETCNTEQGAGNSQKPVLDKECNRDMIFKNNNRNAELSKQMPAKQNKISEPQMLQTDKRHIVTSTPVVTSIPIVTSTPIRKETRVINVTKPKRAELSKEISKSRRPRVSRGTCTKQDFPSSSDDDMEQSLFHSSLMRRNGQKEVSFDIRQTPSPGSYVHDQTFRSSMKHQRKKTNVSSSSDDDR